MVQRRKAHHAQLVSHEVETGGSDPMLPDFWEEDLVSLELEERHLAAYFDEPTSVSPSYPVAGPSGIGQAASPRPATIVEREEDQWATEAAEAEEAELEAEEAEIARRVEEAYGAGNGSPKEVTMRQDQRILEPNDGDDGMMDWEMEAS